MAIPRKQPSATTRPADSSPGEVADGGYIPGPPDYLQAVIPQLRGIAERETPNAQPVFAHPFERVFAEILSFYGEPWTYEPTPFVLAEGPDGMATELFMPDFYLPRQRLYIELTAMRQRLVTRKHRKLRHLAERYPNVRVKLLYRRDYERLETTYRSEKADRTATGTVLIDEATIRGRVAVLAREIVADHAARGDATPLVCLAVGESSEAFATLLVEHLAREGLPVAVDGINVSKFRPDSAGDRVRLTRKPVGRIAGCRVLLVADIVSTGLTLNFVSTWLVRHRTLGVEVCALLDRSEARIVDVPLRYIGFTAPNELLVGFGLRLFEEFRGLPNIRSLAPAGDGAD